MLDGAGHLQVIPVQVGLTGQRDGLHAVQVQTGGDLLGAGAGSLVHGTDAVLAAAARLDVQVVLPLPTNGHMQLLPLLGMYVCRVISHLPREH